MRSYKSIIVPSILKDTPRFCSKRSSQKKPSFDVIQTGFIIGTAHRSRLFPILHHCLPELTTTRQVPPSANPVPCLMLDYLSTSPMTTFWRIENDEG